MTRSKDNRGYLVSTKVLKKHWLREDDIEVHITDGQNDIYFLNTGSFTLETDKPLIEQAIKSDWWNAKVGKK